VSRNSNLSILGIFTPNVQTDVFDVIESQNVFYLSNQSYQRLPVACSDDESCVEPDSKQPNDTDIDHYFTNANSTRLPFTTNQPPTPLTSTLPVSKPPVAQSNSSLKLSEDLRTEYERQSFVVKPLFSRCDLPQNSYSKKSLVDLTNLADKYSLKSTATGIVSSQQPQDLKRPSNNFLKNFF